MGSPSDVAVAHSAGTAPPRWRAPPGATDCHVHVYAAALPAAPGTPHPGDAGVDALRALLARLRLDRVVLVQPSAYGTDNALHVAAVAMLGRDCARLVAVVDADVPEAELDRLADAGTRGVRLNLVRPGPLPLPAFADRLAARIAARGWHAQLNLTGEQLMEAGELLAALPCDVVLDHLGGVPQPQGTAHPAFAALCRLLDGGRCWVKLSAPYATSRAGAPDYADAGAVAAALARHAPHRVLWGSDWPHPSCPGAPPDDASIVDLAMGWMPDDAGRQALLVDNPAALYGFA